MKKEKWKDVNCKDKLCVSLCVGMGMVRKLWWGFFRGKKRKRKIERKMERGVENEMKINGDGYGKNKLVEEKMGIGVELTK